MDQAIPSERHRIILDVSHEGNWDLPFEPCQLLYSPKVPVDRILWHHPYMHADADPTEYWKKGHKVRIKAGDFAEIGYELECKRL